MQKGDSQAITIEEMDKILDTVRHAEKELSLKIKKLLK